MAAAADAGIRSPWRRRAWAPDPGARLSDAVEVAGRVKRYQDDVVARQAEAARLLWIRAAAEVFPPAAEDVRRARRLRQQARAVAPRRSGGSAGRRAAQSASTKPRRGGRRPAGASRGPSRPPRASRRPRPGGASRPRRARAARVAGVLAGSRKAAARPGPGAMTGPRTRRRDRRGPRRPVRPARIAGTPTGRSRPTLDAPAMRGPRPPCLTGRTGPARPHAARWALRPAQRPSPRGWVPGRCRSTSPATDLRDLGVSLRYQPS